MAHTPAPQLRTLEQLINKDDSGIVVLKEMITAESNETKLLVCNAAAGEQTLLLLQVTTRSILGAIAYETGGILIDHAWIRILGAGCAEFLPSLASLNGISREVQTSSL